jgi:hypothetical protein
MSVSLEKTRHAAVDTVTHAVAVAGDPWPHEPPGFTKVTERDFSKLARSRSDTDGIDGWDASEESRWPNVSIVNDPTAPRSPPSVLQARYPIGTVGGTTPATPGRIVKKIAGSPQWLYLSVWVQLSSNWRAHSTGTNKILYVWMDGGPKFFLSAEGSNAADLAPAGRLQGTPDDELRRREQLMPNVSPKRVIPGKWQRWEVLLKANTPGASNGEFHVWIDGVETGRYTDVAYLASNEKTNWTAVDVEPIWGGGGDRLPATQTMKFDHIYVSQK